MAGSSKRFFIALGLVIALSKLNHLSGAFTAPQRCIARKASQSGTESVIDVAPDPSPKPSNQLNETEILDLEKKARVLAKTAETKKRVAEKKERLKGQTEGTNNKVSEDKSLVDWETWAAQARRMTEEARIEATKPESGEVDVLAAKTKESFFQAASVGFDAAAEAPPFLLAASAGVGSLVLVLLLSFSSKPASTGETRPAVTSAVPEIVSLRDESSTPMPPKQQLPSSPSPKPIQATPAAVEVPWARGLANVTAGALRSLADGLPGAEKVVEAELPAALPAAQSALEWASGVNLDNAPEKVQKDVLPFAGRVAEDAVRLGLKAGADGLDFVGQNLPAAEKAVGSVVDSGLPLAQSALREVASNARQLAAENLPVDPSNPYAQGAAAALPEILKATAGALDIAADAAPAVKSALGYAAGAVTPVAQVALSKASDLVDDASKIPSSTVQKSLSEAAGAVVDTARTAAQAVESVKAAAPADAARQLLSSSPAEMPLGTEWVAQNCL